MYIFRLKISPNLIKCITFNISQVCSEQRIGTKTERLLDLPKLPSPSEENDVLGYCRRHWLQKLDLLQQIFIGHLLYASH